MNDFLYDTYEVRISNMQALLMQSSNEQLVPAQHAIVERFQLAIRYQRRRMPPTVGPLEDEFGHQQAPAPSHRLTLSVSPRVAVRLTAKQYDALLELFGHVLRPHRRRGTSVGTAANDGGTVGGGTVGDGVLGGGNVVGGNVGAGTAAGGDVGGTAGVDRGSAASRDEMARGAPPGSMHRVGSASEVLSTRLYQAATRMFQRHAAQIELQSLLIMPELSVEMRYLLHDGNVEIGLLDARLVGLRAELTSRPEPFSVICSSTPSTRVT